MRLNANSPKTKQFVPLGSTFHNNAGAMLQLHCLGAGAGVTAIYNDEPSSSWALSQRGRPFFMADLGIGVCKSAQKHLGRGAILFLVIKHKKNQKDMGKIGKKSGHFQSPFYFDGEKTRIGTQDASRRPSSSVTITAIMRQSSLSYWQ